MNHKSDVFTNQLIGSHSSEHPLQVYTFPFFFAISLIEILKVYNQSYAFSL